MGPLRGDGSRGEGTREPCLRKLMEYWGRMGLLSYLPLGPPPSRTS